MLKKFSPLGLIVFLFLSHMVLFFSFRLGLFYFVYPQITDNQAIVQALYIGLKFDARYAVFLILLTCLCLIVPFLERLLVSSTIFRFLVCSWQTLVFFLFLLAYLVDFIVYFYLNQRVDLTLLDLLKEADIGFAMVWQSYPVVWISLAFLVVTGCYHLFWNNIFKKHIPSSVYRKKNMPKFNLLKQNVSTLGFALALRFGILLGLFVLGYGQISSNFFPLRWSNAYFSIDKNIALIALSPMQNIFDTRNAIDFIVPDEKYAREAYGRMQERLNIPNDNAVMDFSRFHAGDKPDIPLNVVIIMMESWTNPKASLPHGTGAKEEFADFDAYPQDFALDTTPFARELMQNSLYYPNFYANSRTTARGIMSTLTGIADVNFLTSTSSRNPLMVDQQIIFNEFDGYERYYMLGGNANWANIRGIFQNNIDGLQLLEESAWKAPNTDVWGISDLALLRESVDILNQSKKPFIAFIQTAGYHRPFTIPKDNEGFEYAPSPAKEVLDAWGFVGEEEYHALRFVDHALKRFFEWAKQTSWYENTVFILFGDHGTTEHNELMNKSYLAGRLQFWHTPFFIHCPKYVPALVNPALHSQADIFPTVAALAGISYRNTTLGQPMLEKVSDGNVFIPREFVEVKKDGKTSYIYDDNLAKQLGNYVYIAESEGRNIVLSDEFAYISDITDKEQERDALYDVGKDSAENLKNKYPELAGKLRQIADDYYYTCKYLLLHNQKNNYQQE